MATKNELAINNKWSQLTKKEKSRFKNKQSFSKRRQTQLAQQSSGSKLTSSYFSNASTDSPFGPNTTTYAPGVSIGPQILEEVKTPPPIVGPTSAPPDPNPLRPEEPTPAPQSITPDYPDLFPIDEPFVGPIQEEETPETEPFDIEGLIASLTESIGGPFQTEIDRLTGELGDANTTISGYETTIGGLREDIDNQKIDYDRQIGGLQGTLETYGGLMTGYQNQITGLRDDLRKAQEQANQLKIRDTRYIADNSAGGVRLKRSNKFNSGAFAMGTGQLNRNFKSPLSISNVNL